MPSISEAEYVELVDFTGRELHPGKRGKIASNEPKALTKLGFDKNHWTRRMKGFCSGYWREVGGLRTNSLSSSVSYAGGSIRSYCKRAQISKK